jgi:glycosyltransferase involved in cell wall biosynthesis
MLVDNPCNPDPRVLREGAALAQAGAQVTVVAWNRDGVASATEERLGVRIQRYGPVTRAKLGVRQLLHLLRFWTRAAVSFPKPVDVIVAHDFLTLPIATLVATIRKVPLVYDAHEIYRWMDEGRLPALGLRFAGWLERVLIDRAVDLFIIPSSVHERLYWRHMVRRRPIVAGNWYDPVENGQGEREAREGLRVGLGGRPVVAYAGSLQRERRVDLLIDAAIAAPDIDVVIAGRGDPEMECAVAKAGAEVPNLRWLGWVQDASTPLRACDAVYYALDDSRRYSQFSSPNALFTAIALNRPLIARLTGEIADVARRSRGVVALQSLTGEGVAEAARQAVRLRELGDIWGAVRQEYTWRRAQECLVEAFDAVLRRPRPAL